VLYPFLAEVIRLEPTRVPVCNPAHIIIGKPFRKAEAQAERCFDTAGFERKGVV
jgi:hypothetical protein